MTGLQHLLRRCDKTRLPWGSDQGYGLADCYPYRSQIMGLVKFSDADREAIFAANARRLLRL